MALNRLWIAAMAGGAALLMPIGLLWPRGAAVDRPTGAVARPVTPSPLADIGAVYERQLFAPADGVGEMPADAPALVGIAGRLNRDAVALVRLSDGSARTLAVGASVDGWRLESLAIDAAFFTRGRERVRVAMVQDAVGDDPPFDDDAR